MSLTAILASGLAVAGLALGIAVAVLGPRGKAGGGDLGAPRSRGERRDRDPDLPPQDESDLFAVPQRHRG